jgi:hypothetical protein
VEAAAGGAGIEVVSGYTTGKTAEELVAVMEGGHGM